MQRKRVAIIGAGVSGLAAALKLSNLPEVEVTVFEARKKAGGRTRSYIDPHTGDVLDNGQHLLLGAYEQTLAFLDAIGSRALIQTTSVLDIQYTLSDERRTARLRTSDFFGVPLHLLSGLVRTDLLTWREKMEAIRFGVVLRRPILSSKISDWTCETLFATFNQSSGTVRKLWEPIVLATMNTKVSEASATIFVNVLRKVFFERAGHANILYPSVGLSELLIDPAIEKLRTSGTNILCNSPVRLITRDRNQFIFQIADNNLAFDFVIYATQTSPYEIFPELRQHEVVTPEYSPIFNAYFWLDTKIIQARIHGFIGTTLQWAFPKPSVFCPQLLALTVSAADELVLKSNEDIRDLLWRELQTNIPAAQTAKLLHSQIIREKRATFRLTPQLNLARPTALTSIPNFYLASDLPQNRLPATIEGAIINGNLAARRVLSAEC